MNVTPLGNRVLVELATQETKTKGGIFLPETASKDRPNRGKVVAVGAGARNKKGILVPMQVKVGSNVVYAQYAGDEIEIEGKKHLLIKEDEILAIE
ncbi:MAG TPA: co-chaperone GroES [Candidatus Ozemobacteraceae bacterium]|nr:co-chaperone GroES [Candidatus Ozemobacteraceae bacterium]